jgi:hypothetical protein
MCTRVKKHCSLDLDKKCPLDDVYVTKNNDLNFIIVQSKQLLIIS